jgi:O2-independent ubiquinone biosynthesis accessory factor UbiT
MHLPPFPRSLRKLVSRLPHYPASAAFAAALTLFLGDTINARSQPALAGKRVCIHVLDAGMTFTFTATASGFVPAGAPANVTFTASADDFLALVLRREDPDTLFFKRRLLIEGDTELGLLIKNTLDGLDFKLRLPPPQALLALLPRPLANRCNRRA